MHSNEVLIVEDEIELARDIAKYLTDEQYRCELVSDYTSAMERIYAYEYDCILLDLMLPGGDGLTVE